MEIQESKYHEQLELILSAKTMNRNERYCNFKMSKFQFFSIIILM